MKEGREEGERRNGRKDEPVSFLLLSVLDPSLFLWLLKRKEIRNEVRKEEGRKEDEGRKVKEGRKEGEGMDLLLLQRCFLWLFLGGGGQKKEGRMKEGRNGRKE